MHKLVASILLAASLATPLALTTTATANAATDANAELVNGISAIVNDEIITIYELNREFARARKEEEKKGPLSEEALKKLRSDVLNSMVDKKLIGMKIRELNIVVGEEELRQSIEEIKKQNNLSQEALVSALLSQGMTFDQYKAQMKEQLERLRLMSQEVKSKIQVTERELQEYYDNNKSQFREDPTYRARHIFFKIEKNAGNEQIKKVMEKAARVAAEARGSQDFIELVKKYSDDPNAATDGGDLGSFKKGDMLPEIENAVIGMNQGEISDLVTTPAGFHIIKLEGKSAETIKPFESVKGTIDELLYRKKSEERFSQWVIELRKSANIEIKQ